MAGEILVSADTFYDTLPFFLVDMAALADRCRAEKATVLHNVERYVNDPAMATSLEKSGFFHFKQLVQPALITAARGEVNRELGLGNADTFKGKTFPKHPALLDVFNKSAVPLLLEQLLADARPVQGATQIALRFPGDNCIPGTMTTNSQHYQSVRRGWHIDGLPNKFLPGVTDHFGEIHNFDVLVGVLLSSTQMQNSGELVVYPGSHQELADYFKQGDTLQRCYKNGNSELPTGARHDSVIKQQPFHCIGDAGDVFICNYMTAHWVAPNTSPDIRYALYFRITSNHHRAGARQGGRHNPQSMLAPWTHWRGLPRLQHEQQQGGNKFVAPQADYDNVGMSVPGVPPKCQRSTCSFRKHSSQPHAFCCFACKDYGVHGPACEKQPSAAEAGGTGGEGGGSGDKGGLLLQKRSEEDEEQKDVALAKAASLRELTSSARQREKEEQDLARAIRASTLEARGQGQGQQGQGQVPPQGANEGQRQPEQELHTREEHYLSVDNFKLFQTPSGLYDATKEKACTICTLVNPLHARKCAACESPFGVIR